MTDQQKKKFQSEWDTFRLRWGITVHVQAKTEDAWAQFNDGDLIRIEESCLHDFVGDVIEKASVKSEDYPRELGSIAL